MQKPLLQVEPKVHICNTFVTYVKNVCNCFTENADLKQQQNLSNVEMQQKSKYKKPKTRRGQTQ